MRVARCHLFWLPPILTHGMILFGFTIFTLVLFYCIPTRSIRSICVHVLTCLPVRDTCLMGMPHCPCDPYMGHRLTFFFINAKCAVTHFFIPLHFAQSVAPHPTFQTFVVMCRRVFQQDSVPSLFLPINGQTQILVRHIPGLLEYFQTLQ